MKKKKIALVAAVVLALAAAGYAVWKKKQDKAGKESFRTVTVEKGALRITVQATGTTLPQNRLELKPPVAGRIEAMLVAEGERVRKGQTLAWLSSTERAALLDAARAKGAKELAYWEDAYRATPLLAPMEGVIIARKMEPGQSVTSADALLVMSDRLIVKAQVDETDIGRLHRGQKAEIVLDAYPENRVFGRIDLIAYEAKTVNNVTIYEIDVLPEKVPDFMRSGMTANVTFLVQEKKGVLILPEEAVRSKDGGKTVLVPSEDGGKGRQGRSRTIATGISDGKKVEVTEGLAEGDTVLVPEVKLGKRDSRSGSGNPFSPFGGTRPASGSGGGSRR